MYFDYLRSLIDHKKNVFVAGRKLKVPIFRLIFHDWQKFTPKEFPVYARYFFGGKQNKEEFMYAWRHHLKYGPHHWDYWCINSNYNFSTASNGLLPMPETYIREMIADWMGASKTYTGSWDMQDWLNDNLDRIQLHSTSRNTLLRILKEELGYYAN